MDVAVGEGWTIVEDKFWSILLTAMGKNFFVKPAVLPLGESPRFVLHQISPHWKSRLRQGQGLFVIRCGTHIGGRTLAMPFDGVNHQKPHDIGPRQGNPAVSRVRMVGSRHAVAK